ncbi:integrase catalytic domain-containing protein [Trichonephila clavipes]|nr:integrase catalytic domain-containing protein [Trichonephila clavipes]
MRANFMRTNANMHPCCAVPADENFLWKKIDEKFLFNTQTKSYNELLSDNYPLAKQRFQNLWRRFGHDSELYQQYREIIHDYTEQGVIEEVKTEITDNKLKRPVYYLPHQAIRKDSRLTSKTGIVFDAGKDDVEWHSFCDASKKAYGAAIHLRTKSRNGISVKLVTSKSRVAPLNCVTLSKLELLGALVAARQASKVKKIVNPKRSCLQYHWTDSKIVLFWIKGNKTRGKQFVANRVNEITSLTDPHSWYHCAGAEFLSDSEFPKNFQQVVPELDYLTEHEKETVVQERKKLPEADRSEETVLLNSNYCGILDELLELSNNYFKVINILSYIFRFNYNCRNKSKKVGPLTVAEFKESEIKLIKYAQRSLFDKKEIPSSISNLFPFVDGEGIVRVGRRLENASVPYLHKNPAILPKGSKLSKLYFNSLHTRLFHVGPQGLLNAVRQKFWPLSGRSIARKTVDQCVTCFKSRPILSSQIMGNLPSERMKLGYNTICPKQKYSPNNGLQKGEPAPKKATVFWVGKVIVTVFWDSPVVILIDYLQKRKTVTRAYYASLLGKLKAELSEKKTPFSGKENPVSPRQHTVSHLSGCRGKNLRIMV